MIKKKAGAAALAIVTAAAIFGISFVGAKMGAASSSAAGTEAATVEAQQSITIPGYEAIQLKAQQTAQEVQLYNPAENNCFFTVSLILDGAELFTTEPISPGEELTTVELSQPLAAGVYYDTILRYSCYDLESMEPLNGADVALIMEVKP